MAVLTAADFLPEIIAAPDDDAPRAALADFLQESDDPADRARGEFVAVQVELARRGCVDLWCEKISREKYPIGKRCELADGCDELRRRERELFTWHNIERWFGHAPWLRTTVDPVEFDRLSRDRIFAMLVRRGFVETVGMTAEDWLRHADALTAAHPIREVRLATWPDIGWDSGPGRVDYILAGRGHSIRQGGGVLTTHDAASVLLKVEWPRITFRLPGDG